MGLHKLRGLFGRDGGARVPAAAARPGGLPSTRSFAAAEGGHLYGAWSGAGLSTDALLRLQLQVVQTRSRDLARNNPFARKFLALLKTNVVGHAGTRLQVRPRTRSGAVDRRAGDLVERGWADFRKLGNFDVTGKLSGTDAEGLFIQTAARDGECIVRIVEGAPGAHRFGVQFIPVECLDVGLVRELPNGNLIYMGVEYDAWRRAVGYWFLTSNPNGDVFGRPDQRYVRVDARDVIHAFVAEDAEQTRGIPWYVAGMKELKMLGGYIEAELVAARAAASKMGFYKRTNPFDDVPGDVLGNGEVVDESTPGHWTVLPPGVEIETFDPQHPNSSFDMFVKASLRAFASSTGAAGYATVANDGQGVNYSTLRHFTLEEREAWKAVQAWKVEHFDQPIFERWLAWCLNTGQLGGLSYDQFDKLNAPVFRPRGWAWVDPVKEGQGQKLALEMKTTSRTAICAAQGRDFEDVLEELAAEAELAGAYGVELAAVDAKLGVAPAEAAPGDKPDPPDPDEPDQED